MKKFLLLLFLPLLVMSTSFAYSDRTNQFISAFEQKLQTMNTAQQKDYLKLIQSIIDAPQVKESQKADIQRLVRELKERLQSKS